MGQPDLDTGRLASAKMLRALINVEGHFFANVDYQTAFPRGVRLLGVDPRMRGLSQGTSSVWPLTVRVGSRRRTWRCVTEKERTSVSQSGAPGAPCFCRHSEAGNLDRRLHWLIQPFPKQVRIYDPWRRRPSLRTRVVSPQRWRRFHQPATSSTFSLLRRQTMRTGSTPET